MNIEQYIKNNRSAFDDKEPAAGHFKRFTAKWKKQNTIKFPRKPV
jgi:hypothetical protein